MNHPEALPTVQRRELHFHVLSYLAASGSRGSHGYAIARFLRERFNCDVRLPVVYDILACMKEEGLVDVRASDTPSLAGPLRKMYSITAKGMAHLREEALDMTAMVQRLQQSIDRARQTGAVPGQEQA